MPRVSRLAFLALLAVAAAPAHANTKVANASEHPARGASVPAAASEPSATVPNETSATVASDSSETRARVIVTKPPSAITLMVQYQRVGRAILDLQDQRGAYDCSDLMPRFRAIKLEPSLATPALRAVLSVTLDELAVKVERMRGIHIDKACLDNPLAVGCQ